jgi:hypothetical protein
VVSSLGTSTPAVNPRRKIPHDAASALSLLSELLELEAAKLKRTALPASAVACSPIAVAERGGGGR